MSGFYYVGGVYVDAARIVGVEPRAWDNAHQDHWATFVMDGGARIPVAMLCKNAIAALGGFKDESHPTQP